VGVVCRTGRLSHGEESGFRGALSHASAGDCVDWQNTGRTGSDWLSSDPGTGFRHVKVELFWFAAAAAMCSSTHFSILLPVSGHFCDASALGCATISSRLRSQHAEPCDV
jgi:hypothetical protein